MPVLPDTSELLVCTDSCDYCASEMAKAVEDCDVQLLGLAVTGMSSAAGHPFVWLRVGARNTSAVERSLARYGYETVYTLDADRRRVSPDDRERVNELLRYLEV